jgi:hypothetical protein
MLYPISGGYQRDDLASLGALYGACICGADAAALRERFMLGRGSGFADHRFSVDAAVPGWRSPSFGRGAGGTSLLGWHMLNLDDWSILRSGGSPSPLCHAAAPQLAPGWDRLRPSFMYAVQLLG